MAIDYLYSIRWDVGKILDRKFQVKRGAKFILGEAVERDEHLKWWLGHMVDFGQVPPWGIVFE